MELLLAPSLWLAVVIQFHVALCWLRAAELHLFSRSKQILLEQKGSSGNCKKNSI